MTTVEAPFGADVSSPLWIRFGEREKQSRLTIFFRIILLIPQYIVVYFLQLALFFAAIFSWFAALVTGRVPESLAAFMTGVIRWVTRVEAYGAFLTGRYPPFALESKDDYPVDVTVQSGPLNRFAVLFRIILVIPAGILNALIVYGMGVFSIILWLAALILGELPESFFGGVSAVIRFQARVSAYFVMLTSYYPGRLMGDPVPAPVATPAPVAAPAEVGAPATPAPATATAAAAAAPPAAPSPWELVLSQGAKVLVVVFIVIGVAAAGGAAAISAAANSTSALGSLGTAIDKSVTLQDANNVYNSMGKAATTFSSSVQSCGSNLPCVQASAATLATALGTYASRLGSLNVPSSALQEQRAAQQAARQASAQVAALTTVASYGAFAQAVNSNSFSSTLDSVDSTFNKMETAIANGS